MMNSHDGGLKKSMTVCSFILVNYPQMAELFRLVKYYNLPRIDDNSIPMDPWPLSEKVRLTNSSAIIMYVWHENPDCLLCFQGQ